MYNFSLKAQSAFTKGKVTRAYLRVLATDTEEEFIINEENFLKDLEFSDERWVENEGFIGQAVCKSLTGNFYNIEQNLNLQDRELELYFGVDVDGDTEYVKYGTFIVQKPKDNTVNDNTSFEALDYMIKFNSLYVDTMVYPCTIKDIFENIVNSEGMVTGEENFLNQDYMIYANPFPDGTTKRDALKAIAQIAFSWVRIDENNIVRIDFDKNCNVAYTISPDEYFKLDKKPKMYGELNVLKLSLGEVEGEYTIIRDEESISKYGETELNIVNNPIANTEQKRYDLIQAGRTILGLKYYAVNADLIGLAFLNCKDRIIIESLQGEQFETYVFNHIIRYSGTLLDSIKTDCITNAESKYQYNPTIYNAIRRTELSVDKVNQSIKSVIQKQDEQLTQITDIQENLQGIQATVDQINNLVKEVIGNTTIKLEDCKEGNLLSLRIYGNNTVFQHSLYPSNDLYPSDNLYMEGSARLYVYTDILLPSDDLYPSNDLYPQYGQKTFIDLRVPYVLRQLNEKIYDEFVLEDNIAYVIRRVGIDDFGLYALPTPIIEQIGQMYIPLNEGNNYLSLANDNEATIKASYATRTSLTDVFAEVVEMKNKIAVTEDSYSIEVTKTIDSQKKQSSYKQVPDKISITAEKIELNGIDFQELLTRIENLEKKIKEVNYE